MRDILPPYILNAIRDRYFAGITDAELAYRYSAGDEDSLTGALGQSIITEHTHFVIGSDESAYEWSITYYKVRGRGPDAPEKKTGADGVFQIELSDLQGKVIRRKGLLFQSKKEWVGTDAKLLAQARLLAKHPQRAIVVDYSPSGYRACLASAAVRAQGNRRGLSEDELKRLAQVLGDDFLRCDVGIIGMYYDPETEELYDPTEAPSNPGHVVATRIRGGR